MLVDISDIKKDLNEKEMSTIMQEQESLKTLLVSGLTL